MCRGLPAKLFTQQTLPSIPPGPRRTKVSASWEDNTAPSYGSGDRSLEAEGPAITCVDVHSLATGDVGLAQGIPHEQHFVRQEAMHQKQLPVEAGVEGGQTVRGGPNASRADTVV